MNSTLVCSCAGAAQASRCAALRCAGRELCGRQVQVRLDIKASSPVAAWSHHSSSIHSRLRLRTALYRLPSCSHPVTRLARAFHCLGPQDPCAALLPSRSRRALSISERPPPLSVRQSVYKEDSLSHSLSSRISNQLPTFHSTQASIYI
jgi:hypothetical protein